jgi:hypothetical protein
MVMMAGCAALEIVIRYVSHPTSSAVSARKTHRLFVL